MNKFETFKSHKLGIQRKPKLLLEQVIKNKRVCELCDIECTNKSNHSAIDDCDCDCEILTPLIDKLEIKSGDE